MFNIVLPKHSTKERQRFTVIQAAKHLGVSRQHVHKLVQDLRIPSHQYLGRTCIFVDECVLPPKRLTGYTGNRRGGYKPRRRTKEQIAQDKKREAYRRSYYKAKKKAFDSLSPEEQAREKRKKRNTKMKKLRRRLAAAKKKSKGQWNSTDGIQG